jgi:hypothetical protein
VFLVRYELNSYKLFRRNNFILVYPPDSGHLNYIKKELNGTKYLCEKLALKAHLYHPLYHTKTLHSVHRAYLSVPYGPQNNQ